MEDERKGIEAKARQKRRLKQKIKKMITENEAVFLSMTFKDEYLNESTEEERERAIKRFLSSQLDIYIANKDYGKSTKREHYHALGVAIASKVIAYNIKRDKPKLYSVKDHINLSRYATKYGKIKCRFIQKPKASATDEEKALYWKKTTEDIYNHFKKETTRESRIIQGRTKPKNFLQQIERIEATAKAEAESRKKRFDYFNSLTDEERKNRFLKKGNNKAVIDKANRDQEILNDALADVRQFLKSQGEEQSESDYFRFIDEATGTD